MPISLKPDGNQPITHRLKSDAILLFVSAVWGSGFVAQRVASESMSNFTFNGVRFLIGALLLIILVRFRIKIERKHLGWTFLAGGLLFCASTLQQVGVKTTTAANAGFITGLYVVIIPILLAVFDRQRIHWTIWVAAVIATIGTGLLSAGGQIQPSPGDWIVLAGAFLWALHVIVVGKMARAMDNLQFTIAQFVVCGLFNLFCSLAFDLGLPAPLNRAWLAVLYSAIFPVGMGFTLQVIGQRHAPTTDAAIIFSMEAVFAALFGYWLLNESLLAVQIFGCLMILGAITVAQVRPALQKLPAPTSG
jgi:drug/metabolite transporter (DMT)-like permease